MKNKIINYYKVQIECNNKQINMIKIYLNNIRYILYIHNGIMNIMRFI